MESMEDHSETGAEQNEPNTEVQGLKDMADKFDLQKAREQIVFRKLNDSEHEKRP